jgi:aspartyl protease family protein
MKWQSFPIAIGVFLAMLWLKPIGRAEVAPARPEPQLVMAATAPAEVRLKKRQNGHFYTHGLANGQVVEFLVDTGASSVVLTLADARRIGLQVDPRRFRVIGTGASGAVRGTVARLDQVEIAGRTLRGVEVMVAQGLRGSLLGQDFLRHLQSVSMSGDTMVLK